MPKEVTIKDIIETIESPFELGKFHMGSISKRNSPAGKKASNKIRRIKINCMTIPRSINSCKSTRIELKSSMILFLNPLKLFILVK